MKLILIFIYSLAGICFAQNFFCALPNFCDNAVSVSIDLRIQSPNHQSPNIVTPGLPTSNGNCPSPYIQCRNVRCGYSSGGTGTTNCPAVDHSFPFNAFLRLPGGSNNRYIGGGVLIDQNWVLTAAHKVANLTSGTIEVIVGQYAQIDFQGGCSPPNCYIATLPACYCNYNPGNFQNDIALLKLNTPVYIGNPANIACLPNQAVDYTTSGQTCTVAGWGQTSFTTYDAATPCLKQANVPIQTAQKCIEALRNLNIDTNWFNAATEICAGGENQLDACTGDGGSGLYCKDANQRMSVVGLVIWGKGCGMQNVYGVYTYVKPYLNWINTAINNNQCPQQCALYV